MLNVIQVVLLVCAVAVALPTTPNQLENEISDNELDFEKELPFEHEYYRTSTDRDEFIKPSATDDSGNIEGIEDGIDLNDETFKSLVPLCNYQITLTDFNGSVDNLAIDIQGLTVKNGRKSNLALKDFMKLARKQILERIRNSNLAQDTQSTVNDVTNYLRHIFTKTYGYEDSCGISITLLTRTQPSNNAENGFKETSSEVNDEMLPSTPSIVGTTEDTVKQTSENPVNDEKTLIKPLIDTVVTEIQPEETTIDDSVELITEIQQTKPHKAPKPLPSIKAIIATYKALNNWRYS